MFLHVLICVKAIDQLTGDLSPHPNIPLRRALFSQFIGRL
jgi:hypothetical protein